MLDRLEQQMRDQLSSDVRLMNDLQATKRLAELKKHFDETLERCTIFISLKLFSNKEIIWLIICVSLNSNATTFRLQMFEKGFQS